MRSFFTKEILYETCHSQMYFVPFYTLKTFSNMKHNFLKILEENILGGPVLDLLSTQAQTGNTILQEMYKVLLEKTYQVLYH